MGPLGIIAMLYQCPCYRQYGGRQRFQFNRNDGETIRRCLFWLTCGNSSLCGKSSSEYVSDQSALTTRATVGVRPAACFFAFGMLTVPGNRMMRSMLWQLSPPTRFAIAMLTASTRVEIVDRLFQSPISMVAASREDDDRRRRREFEKAIFGAQVIYIDMQEQRRRHVCSWWPSC